MMTEIQLLGSLGERFGAKHRLDLTCPSVGEAVRALTAICPGFRAWILAHARPGFHVFAGDRALDESELRDPTGKQRIIIQPVLAGAKADWVKVVLGGLLIAAGVTAMVLTGGAASGAAIELGATALDIVNGVATAAIGYGLNLGITGISNMLASHATPAQTDSKNSPAVFSGPVNTTGVGVPVPVLYGELEIGSHIISADVSDYSVTATAPDGDTQLPNPGPGTWIRGPRSFDPDSYFGGV